MSIYATQWTLKFPRYGDAHSACGRVAVIGQGGPPHTGTATPGYGYESGDPYSSFLSTCGAGSGRGGITVAPCPGHRPRSNGKVGQEYIGPLIVLSGEEYDATPFQVLYDRICDALRGNRPRLVAEIIDPSGSRLVFDDGTVRPAKQSEPRRPRLNRGA